MGLMRMAHIFSHTLGQEFVSSNEAPSRRLNAEELALLDPWQRAAYLAANPLTDEERTAELERKMRDIDYEESGLVDDQDRLDNHPPVDWGR
jgi:hypothetical protein